MTDFDKKLPNRDYCLALARFLYKESVKKAEFNLFYIRRLCQIIIIFAVKREKRKIKKYTYGILRIN